MVEDINEPVFETTFGSVLQDLEHEMEKVATQVKAVREWVEDINKDLKGDLTRVVQKSQGRAHAGGE